MGNAARRALPEAWMDGIGLILVALDAHRCAVVQRGDAIDFRGDPDGFPEVSLAAAPTTFNSIAASNTWLAVI